MKNSDKIFKLIQERLPKSAGTIKLEVIEGCGGRENYELCRDAYDGAYTGRFYTLKRLRFHMHMRRAIRRRKRNPDDFGLIIVEEAK